MPFIEIGSAFITSFIVSPIMTVIDTSIIKSQFQQNSFFKNFQNTFSQYKNKQISFQKPFNIMFGVYFSTYATANLTEYYCKKNSIDFQYPTLLSTSLVNIGGIAYKDKEYAKMFSNIKPKPFPILSIALFSLRDILTIGSSFVIKKELLKISEPSLDFFLSITVPITAQIFSTPLQILSMDLYNRPNISWKYRLQNIQNQYCTICMGRMIRVLPAFSIGGYVNDLLRSKRN